MNQPGPAGTTPIVGAPAAPAAAAPDQPAVYAVVGAIVTRAPAPALLAVLRALRPEYDVRLDASDAGSRSGLRRHEVSVRVPSADRAPEAGGAIAVHSSSFAFLQAELLVSTQRSLPLTVASSSPPSSAGKATSVGAASESAAPSWKRCGVPESPPIAR